MPPRLPPPRAPSSRLLLAFLGLNMAVWAVVCAGGCAVGRTPAGGIVMGAELGALPETASEVAAAAAGFLPFPFNKLGELAVLGVTAYAANQRGRHKGWEERSAAAGEVPPPPPPRPAAPPVHRPAGPDGAGAGRADAAVEALAPGVTP